MDNMDTLSRMHKLHLMIADEFQRICDANDLRYFIIAGSLLGAVRHGGFIPWDDDMDFGMPRDDYEVFLKVCESELDKEKFFLQTDRNDKWYAFNFAKMRLNGTKVLESFSENVETNQGIYIDIFPIDPVSDSKIVSTIQYKGFWFFRNLLWVKCGYGSDERKKEISYKVAKMLGHLFKVEQLKKKKMKYIMLANGKKTKYVVTSDGTYGLKKETLKSEWIENTKIYSFDGHSYPGIADAEGYLSYFYGDYMKLPPVEKQNHHGRLEVDFGEYERLV